MDKNEIYMMDVRNGGIRIIVLEDATHAAVSKAAQQLRLSLFSSTSRWMMMTVSGDLHHLARSPDDVGLKDSCPNNSGRQVMQYFDSFRVNFSHSPAVARVSLFTPTLWTGVNLTCTALPGEGRQEEA